MVSYEVPKPPLGFFERARESVRLAAAFFKGDKATIADITSDTQFSPLQPLRPFEPNIVGRTWDYTPGINVQIRPDGYGGRISFVQLEAISRQCEILRLVIETVKDQICGFEWQIVPKEDSEADAEDERVDELTQFFKKPDKIHNFDQWLRMLLEQFIVLDALSIYRPKDRVGRPYAFEIVDGKTIKVLIDANGRRPLPPDPAYQQIIKGAPRVDYTMEELLYMPRNLLPSYPLRGYSAVEQILLTAQTSLERAKSQLAFFTEGTLPDSYGEMPAGMTTDSIRAFEDRFNDLLRGNTTQRRGTPFLPSGAKIVPLKQAELKNDADEWFTRIICFCLGVPPTAFIKQMNRSSSETDKERAREEGQLPKMQYIKLVIDELIADFGEDYAEFEFTWREGANQDPKEQADTLKEYTNSGIKTIDEARADLGLDPLPDGQGERAMALTQQGYVPLDAYEQNMAQQQANMEAQAEARAQAAQAAQNGGGGKDGGKSSGQSGAAGGGQAATAKPGGAPPSKDARADKVLGKEVSRKAPPFHPHIVDHAQAELRIKIHQIFQKTAISVARQLAKKHIKLAKDDEDDAEAAAVAASLDLSGLDALVDVTPAYLERIGSENGKRLLTMVGVLNRADLVNQVNEDSLAYAKARSAEMVGKKWVDGELVDNPNADWVISDATRDELQSIISGVYSGEIPAGELEERIKTAGAFSEERANLISRTELLNANAQGTLAGMRGAREAGVSLKKAWNADDQACDICLENEDAGAIDIDEDFPSGDDAPTAHPNCECVLVPIVENESGEEEEDEG